MSQSLPIKRVVGLVWKCLMVGLSLVLVETRAESCSAG